MFETNYGRKYICIDLLSLIILQSCLCSASKSVEHPVSVLLARPDHAAGEGRLVDAVRELLGLQAESSMLPARNIHLVA